MKRKHQTEGLNALFFTTVFSLRRISPLRQSLKKTYTHTHSHSSTSNAHGIATIAATDAAAVAYSRMHAKPFILCSTLHLHMMIKTDENSRGVNLLETKSQPNMALLTEREKHNSSEAHIYHLF